MTYMYIYMYIYIWSPHEPNRYHWRSHGPGHVLDVSLGDQAHEATTHTTWGPTIGGNPMEKQWLMMINID